MFEGVKGLNRQKCFEARLLSHNHLLKLRKIFHKTFLKSSKEPDRLFSRIEVFHIYLKDYISHICSKLIIFSIKLKNLKTTIVFEKKGFNVLFQCKSLIELAHLELPVQLTRSYHLSVCCNQLLEKRSKLKILFRSNTFEEKITKLSRSHLIPAFRCCFLCEVDLLQISKVCF